MEAGQTLDHQPGSGVPPGKSARDRLIRLAQIHPQWALGFADEVWGSRLAQPALRTWAEPDQPLRLVEQTVAKDAPDPKALACDGLLVRWWPAVPQRLPPGRRHREETLWLRFVEGRPVRAVTTQSLAWCCTKLQAQGHTALLLIWDNASWHKSQAVRQWIRTHNRRVTRRGGVRILPGLLPVKSPWLNPIEPRWVHGKRRVVSPDRLLSAHELATRVGAAYGCQHEPHLTHSGDVIHAKVA